MTTNEVAVAKAYRDEAEKFYHTAKTFLKADRKTNWETRILLKKIKSSLVWMIIFTGINAIVCVVAYFYIKSLVEG